MSGPTTRFVTGGICLLMTVLLFLGLAAPGQVSAQVSTPTAGEDALYIDPDGRFAVPIPTNWIAEEHDGYMSVVTDDKKIAISLVVISGTKASDAIFQAMALLNPESSATPLPELMATPSSGSDDVALFTYDDGSQSGQLVQAYGQRVGDVVFVLILQGDQEAVGLRQVQVDKIRFGVQVNPEALGSPIATPAA
jgi:hypothetical protein